MDSLRYALKEWAVTVEALERGATALVVRKGGIREKAFAVPKTRFLLLPGYEHQRPELVKPEYRHVLDEIPDLTDDGPLRFSSFAEVHGAYEISEAEDLERLNGQHMWTHEYAESRFKWRPKKPLTVLVLRTYVLPETVELPFREGYGGCKSWIELEDSVSIGGARPALSDEDFDGLTSQALGVLRGLEPAPVGS
ncbi:DUF1802 family protein [Rubrobacter tropicus]|uniref:DUF1802 family protein n=1 Tax=Rubrobacter tropicus TaxID=2653851 RepID=A0A6G8QCJ2_9ACTN|nr:DUF1802 family protein [Rubrobacter tropicus]QIN83987.1 DUF1802 family protein [Rubrobacter tropicus]